MAPAPTIASPTNVGIGIAIVIAIGFGTDEIQKPIATAIPIPIPMDPHPCGMSFSCVIECAAGAYKTASGLVTSHGTVGPSGARLPDATLLLSSYLALIFMCFEGLPGFCGCPRNSDAGGRGPAGRTLGRRMRGRPMPRRPGIRRPRHSRRANA